MLPDSGGALSLVRSNLSWLISCVHFFFFFSRLSDFLVIACWLIIYCSWMSFLCLTLMKACTWQIQQMFWTISAALRDSCVSKVGWQTVIFVCFFFCFETLISWCHRSMAAFADVGHLHIFNPPRMHLYACVCEHRIKSCNLSTWAVEAGGSKVQA